MKLLLLTAALLTSMVQGKDVLVNCRFLGFEPAKDGITTLVAIGKDGKTETIPLDLEVLSKPVVLNSEKGMILFRKSESDPSVAATAKLPSSATKDVIIFFIPTGKEGLVHETLVLDSSLKAFPPGGGIVLNHCPENARVTIGEHLIEIKPDEMRPFTRPNQIDEFNMVGIRLEVDVTGTWRIVSESNFRFVKEQRHLFITYIDPVTKRPRFWIHHE